MSPKDFFRIVLKIMALLLITNGISPAIANFVSWFGTDFTTVFFVIGIILLFIAFIYFVLTSTDTIIRFLKLDKGFDSDTFNIKQQSKSDVIQLACILVGLYMTFTSLPYIIYEGFIYFKESVSADTSGLYNSSNNYFFYSNIVYLFVGILMIVSRTFIANLFEPKTKN